jgi:hypothetical protein
MKLNNSARELLDRYLLGVRRALTGKKREDIAAEIESSIFDRLEENFPDTAEITEAQVKDVLQEMGSPRKLAASFSPQRFLISPRMFPAYLLVLRIVMAAVVGALTLSIIIGTLAGNGVGSGVPILEYLATLWNGAFAAAAFVTLTFAIIERVSEGKEIEELKEFEKFTADDLPELDETDKQPTIPGTVFEMVMGVIGLAFFTYIFNNNGQLPIFENPSSKIAVVRIFTDNFMRFVPAMMAITGLEVARNATLLAQGRHSSLTNWWQIIMEGANIMLAVFLLRSFPLIALEGFQSLPFAADWDFTQIQSGVNIGLKVILILSILGTGVETLRRLYREARSPARQES